MPSMLGLDGAKRIDPGNVNSDTHDFSFVNTSPHDICDLNIMTWDDDAFGVSPEIKPDHQAAPTPNGCYISVFEPEKQGDSIGIKNKQQMSSGNDWTRSNSTEESDETKIVFKQGKCIIHRGRKKMIE